MTRAFYRSYHEGSGRRAGQVKRLHILREAPVPDQRRSFAKPETQAECYTSAWQGQNSEPVFLDPMPRVPPAGLRWCAHCLGRLADRLGVLNEVGALLAKQQPAAPAARTVPPLPLDAT